MDTSLCVECRLLFTKWARKLRKTQNSMPPRAGEVYCETGHHKALSLLRKAADKGCPVCNLLIGLLQHRMDHKGEFNVEELSSTLQLTGSSVSSDNSTWTLLLKVSRIGRSSIFDITSYDDIKIELHPSTIVLGDEVPIEPSTLSNSALRLIQSWLGKCENEHVGCQFDQIHVPTRLIYLEAQRSRLVDMLSMSEQPRYLTLSHCWGTIKLLQLKIANLQDMQIGIQENELCQTFKDALRITRSLGFKYIWIDSLCIIQDDPDDWRKEASKMGGVYGGSTLTLSASSAPDGSFGCIHNRSPETLKRIHRYQTQIPVGTSSRKYDCLDTTLYEENIQKGPLSTRGWVFQERFLSPRTLHFTKTQLYWECKETLACETYQDRIPQSENHNIIERNKHEAIWSSIVQHYSQRKLTVGDDKLVAMSGIAQWVQRQTGDEYLAGLWKKNFEVQLYWVFEGSSYGQYFEKRAPSWSWAAYDGAIELHTSLPKAGRSLISLVTAETTPVGDDLYGALVSGKLQLEVPHLLVVKLSNNRTPKPYYRSNEPAAISIKKDDGQYEGLSSPSHWYCLPIVEVYDVKTKCFHGIMLEQTKNGVRGQFRRVGTFKASNWEYGHGDDERRWEGAQLQYLNFADALRDPSCWAPDSIYERQAGIDTNGDEKFLITLI